MYHRQLSHSWEQIAALSQNSKSLTVGKFNCEEPSSHESICQRLSVDRYPSVYFIGYGNLNQGPKGSIFGEASRGSNRRIARYTADLRPEAIYDWIRMLSQISYLQRIWTDIKGIFNGRTRAALSSDRLKEKLKKVEYREQLFAKELEKYKAIELFDQLTDNGDPFPLLASLEPDEVFVFNHPCPLRYS